VSFQVLFLSLTKFVLMPAEALCNRINPQL
jgi:hypothetical protein